jgi:hypothetical protein
MEIYTVQWCNEEDFNDTGVKCFGSLKEAKLYLNNMIKINYPKDHTDNWVPDFVIVLEEVVDPEIHFPYLYKISKHIMRGIFD